MFPGFFFFFAYIIDRCEETRDDQYLSSGVDRLDAGVMLVGLEIDGIRPTQQVSGKGLNPRSILVESGVLLLESPDIPSLLIFVFFYCLV